MVFTSQIYAKLVNDSVFIRLNSYTDRSYTPSLKELLEKHDMVNRHPIPEVRYVKICPQCVYQTPFRKCTVKRKCRNVTNLYVP